MSTAAAVIGCGDVSVVHLQAIANLDGIDLVGVCDTDAGRAAAAAERYAVEGLGLKLLRANIAPDNAASRRLAEALGFEATGVLKQAATVRGEPADLVAYAKVLG